MPGRQERVQHAEQLPPWWGIIRMLRHDWRRNDVRRRFIDPTGRWYPIAADESFRRIAATRVSRHRYRGTRSPDAGCDQPFNDSDRGEPRYGGSRTAGLMPAQLDHLWGTGFVHAVIDYHSVSPTFEICNDETGRHRYRAL